MRVRNFDQEREPATTATDTAVTVSVAEFVRAVLTDADQQVRAALRLKASPDRGTVLAELFVESLTRFRRKTIDAYGAGEIDLRELLRVTVACGKFIATDDRARIIEETVKEAITISPKTFNRSRPPVPQFQQQFAIRFLEIFEQAKPSQPLAPQPASNNSSPLLSATLLMLEECGFVQRGRIRPKTLYNWYRQRQGAAVRRKAGRRAAAHKPKTPRKPPALSSAREFSRFVAKRKVPSWHSAKSSARTKSSR